MNVSFLSNTCFTLVKYRKVSREKKRKTDYANLESVVIY